MDLASAEAEIRHVFGDTPITEASIGAAPPDILVKLSGTQPFRELLSLASREHDVMEKPTRICNHPN